MEKLEVYGTGFQEEGVGKVFLVRGKKYLEIDFARNLDLYMSLYNYGDEATFMINKENYPVYLIFDKLYNEVISAQVWSLDKKRIVEEALRYGHDYHEVLKEEEKLYQNNIKLLKVKAEKTKLVQDGVIRWISDEYSLDIAPQFMIKKINDDYQIEFKNNDWNIKKDDGLEAFFMKGMKEGIVVRLRMSGSRYEPFNTCFMKIYQPLMELGTSAYVQMGIEEYMLDKEEKIKKVLIKR